MAVKCFKIFYLGRKRILTTEVTEFSHRGTEKKNLRSLWLKINKKALLFKQKGFSNIRQ
jgi:lipoprotein NlpI